MRLTQLTNSQASVSESIVAAQQEQINLVDELSIHSKMLGGLALGSPDYTTKELMVDRIKADLATTNARLASLQAAESRMAYGAQPVGDGGYADVITSRPRAKDTDNLVGKLALCIFESGVKGKAIADVAASRFPNSQALETIIKATVNPAMTSVTGWAAELTSIGYGQFLDALRAAAILPAVVPAGQRHTFERNASLIIPTRAGTVTDLSAAFRAEGSPIPVKRTTFDKVTLTPKNLGVIVTATEEMLQRSAIDLASYLQQAIIKDTATLLDQVFVSNSAATAISPAGARAGLTAGDTRASTGATAAAITTDLKVMLTALANANMGGSSTRWLMHPKNWFAISMLLTATGTKQFPETENGRLAGVPVVQSNTMPVDIILLIDFEHYSFAIGAPQFLASNVAALHEEDTTPLPLATGTSGAGAITAAPVRSLYQTNSWALRALMDVDFAKLRAVGPVQELTAVSY